MRLHRTVRSLLVLSALAGCVCLLDATTPQERPEPAAVVARVAERVAAYYQRAQQLICVERSTVIPIGADLATQSFARTVESELRLETDAGAAGGLPGVRVLREVRKVNGREPRDRDRTSRSGCTDPTPLSPEPLAFLLPGHRDEFAFTAVRDGKVRNRAALIVEFTSKRRMPNPELVEDEYGHDDCFDWKGPLTTAGRVWVDASTHDVLRLERRITGPTDVRVPLPLQRKYWFPQWLTIDRDDLVMNYKEVVFSEPREVMLLPESIESVTVLRTALQSMRRTQIFSDYRRFLTESRIKVR